MLLEFLQLLSKEIPFVGDLLFFCGLDKYFCPSNKHGIAFFAVLESSSLSEKGNVNKLIVKKTSCQSYYRSIN